MTKKFTFIWIFLLFQIQYHQAQTSVSNHFNQDSNYLKLYGYSKERIAITQLPKIKLDSTLIYNYDSIRQIKTITGKRICEYQNNFLTHIITSYNSANIPTTKNINYYNANGLFIDSENSIYDKSILDFKFVSKSTGSYDSNENTIALINFMYEDSSQSWVKTQASFSTYNTSNQLIEKIEGLYFQPGDQWVPYIRDSFYYDSANFNNEFIRFEWDPITNQYINLSRIEFNKTNNLILEKSYNWENSQWQQNSTSRITLDSSSKIIKRQYSSISNPANPQGNIEYIESYKYNKDGFILESYRQIWRNNTSTRDYILTQYNYDQLNNEIFYSDLYSFDGEISINYAYNQYFDTNVSSADIVGYPYIYPKHQSQLLRAESTNDRMSSHVSGNAEYYYSPISPNALNDHNNTITIFPNPIVDYLNIKSNFISGIRDVQILDIKGNIVFKKSILTDEKINLTELNNGIYFLKLMDKNKNYIQKLIKISN